MFGLAIRGFFRRNRQVRQWIKYTTLDCRSWGMTKVKLKLKANPAPSRRSLDADLLARPPGETQPSQPGMK